MQLSQKQKTFSQCFYCIFKIYIKLYAFGKKKMTVITDVFSERPAAKNTVR